MARKIAMIGALTLLFAIGLTAQSQAYYIQKIVFEQTTSMSPSAGTDDGFVLTLKWGGKLCAFDFPNLPGDDRHRGKSDVYTFYVSTCNLPIDRLPANNVFVRTKGSDAWLPSRFKITAISSGTQRVLIDRSWPVDFCLSTDADDYYDDGLHARTKTCQSEWSLATTTPGLGATQDLALTLRLPADRNGRCQSDFVFSGTLQTAAPHVEIAQQAFSYPVHNVWRPTCDIREWFAGLTAGTWQLRYAIQNGPSTQCIVNLPLISSTAVNFTSGRTGCGTGATFP